MTTTMTAIGFVSAILGALMWVVSTLRHRSHISQCVQDLQRHRRLDRRLIGCVNEIERVLDEVPAGAAGQVPEELVGHARFLFGLRQEAKDNAAELSRHAVRLSWPDGYLTKATLAGRRCELAHGALLQAYEALAAATREYERGMRDALLSSGDGSSAREMSMPLRLLDETAAQEVARLREVCEQGMTHTADACNLRFISAAIFDIKWPVRRSELLDPAADPYQGELRPLGWTGFGPQPLLHVDAR